MTRPRAHTTTRTLTGLITALTALALTGCAAATPAPQPATTADQVTAMLRLDPTPPTPAAIHAAQKDLAKLDSTCTGTNATSITLVNTTHDALAKKGIQETRAAILASVAGTGNDNSKFVPCEDMFNAYAQVRAYGRITLPPAGPGIAR